MRKLGERNYLLISRGVNMLGTFNPDDIMFIFEEELYCNQYDEIYDFLTWVHANGKMFGRGNYEQVFKEFKQSIKK
jgi:hypothetical protein